MRIRVYKKKRKNRNYDTLLDHQNIEELPMIYKTKTKPNRNERFYHNRLFFLNKIDFSFFLHH